MLELRNHRKANATAKTADFLVQRQIRRPGASPVSEELDMLIRDVTETNVGIRFLGQMHEDVCNGLINYPDEDKQGMIERELEGLVRRFGKTAFIQRIVDLIDEEEGNGWWTHTAEDR